MSRNIIWENKSVMLGIILFLTKYNDKLISTDIIIYDDLFRNIAKVLFSNLTVKKRNKGSESSFDINVRSNVQRGLVINNVLNLSEIQNKNFYLLPWYNKDNPMIAFIVKPESTQIVIEKAVKDIEEFTNTKRMLPHDPKNFIDIQCNINIWDSLTEYKILLNYSNKYLVDIIQTYNYISKALGEHTCIPKEITYVGIPVPVKINVPIPVPIQNIEVKEQYQSPIQVSQASQASQASSQLPAQLPTQTTTQAPTLTKIIRPSINVVNTCPAEGCSKYVEIINAMNKKIQALNEIYERKA